MIKKQEKFPLQEIEDTQLSKEEEVTNHENGFFISDMKLGSIEIQYQC